MPAKLRVWAQTTLFRVWWWIYAYHKWTNETRLLFLLSVMETNISTTWEWSHYRRNIGIIHQRWNLYCKPADSLAPEECAAEVRELWLDSSTLQWPVTTLVQWWKLDSRITHFLWSAASSLLDNRIIKWISKLLSKQGVSTTNGETGCHGDL